MKIGIDISPIIYGSGVSVYTKNLVEALLQTNKNDYQLLFYSLRRRLAEVPFSKGRALVKEYRIPPSFFELLWNRLHLFPVENLLGEMDVFHSSDWVQPPAKKAALVTTIHDLSFLRSFESTHPKIFATHKRRLFWVKKEVSRVIAVSQATKDETVELLGIDPEKITVVHEGTPKDALNFKGKEKQTALIKKKFGIRKKYFLAYGSASPRKNIGRLVNAFKKVNRDAQFQLVITGNYSGEADGVVATGFIPREQWLNLFSGAVGFAYPSLYEGFGLPILEGFSLGVPVLTSNLSSMAEVAGEAAIFVDPYSEKEIEKGLREIIAGGEKIKNLVKRGKERGKTFTWEKTARETLKVYEKARQ